MRATGDAPAEAPALQLRDVGKRYGGVQALADVSLRLQRGRFLALLGPSGSGKSTLIRCLAGIERPSAGSIALAGATVADGRTHVGPERRDLAMVFQDFALWPHLTVARNVAFALRRRRLSKAQSATRVSRMLGRVGMAHLAERYPHELSGGEQQRVALARALVAEPSLLLFDEPLSSLDANLRERLRIEIGTLVREIGASAVYITHDQGEAFALGDEIGVLQDGRLVQHGTPEAVYRRPASAFVARFTGLAGELRARMLTPLAGDRGGLVRVLLEPGSRAQPARELTVLGTGLSPEPGQALSVLVRPAAVRLASAGSPDARLAGIVLDCAFRGRGYDHVVELPGGTVLSEIFAPVGRARGEAVGLELDPEGCLAFPVQAGARAAKPPPASAPTQPGRGAELAGGETSLEPVQQREESTMSTQLTGDPT